MKELKTFSVEPKYLDQGASWNAAVIVAASTKDAIAIYNANGGGERGAENYFLNFVSSGGSYFRKRVPEPSRGIYFCSSPFWKEKDGTMFVEPKVDRAIVDAASVEDQAAAAAQEIPDDYGDIVPGFTRATKIDEWRFKSPFGDRAWADQMVAKVSMRKSDRRGRLIDHSGIEFFATSEIFPEEIVNTDLSKLAAAVKREFVLYDVSRRGIVWEEWIEVEISPRAHEWDEDDRSNGKRSEGMEIEYRTIKRGVDPRDKKAYTLTQNGQVILFPLPKAAGERDTNPKTGKKEPTDGSIHRGDWYHYREQRHQYAYIPKTPENLAALDDLCEKMIELRRRLAGVLVQKEIAKSLAGVASRLLSFKGDEQ